jgi:TetR/AcrR family transcriptional regulator, transcriptional repressor for nem operon
MDHLVHNEHINKWTVKSILERQMTNPTSPTESRLTSKGRAMRDRIVKSAAELVYEAGAGETTLDEVRSAVGASKSQLYHYFADKDELLSGVIDFQGTMIIRAQQPELGAIESITSLKRWRDKLVQLCDATGAIGGCPIGSLANELAGHSENHRRALAVHFDHWAAQIEDGLLRAQASGRLGSALDPKALSITFLTAIQGGLLLAKVQGSSRALAAALDEIIRFIENGSSRPKLRAPGRQKGARVR